MYNFYGFNGCFNISRMVEEKYYQSQYICNIFDAVYAMQYYFSNKNENIELS